MSRSSLSCLDGDVLGLPAAHFHKKVLPIVLEQERCSGELLVIEEIATR